MRDACVTVDSAEPSLPDPPGGGPPIELLAAGKRRNNGREGMVFRPVQFLGCKLRSLDAIESAVTDLAPSGAVWDAFTGSTVVAQRLATTGRVVATDALQSSAYFAQAVLGIGRGSLSPSADELLSEFEQALGQARTDEVGPWAEWLAKEADALERSDGAALLDIGGRIPQSWRRDGAGTEIADMLDDDASFRVMSSTYAGTYFGIRQSIRLDAIVTAIGCLEAEGRVGDWSLSVLRTALCGAASDAVFSAGKHFAQPHRVREGKSLTFLRTRVLSDRAVDVDVRFAEAVREIVAAARDGEEGHQAERLTVESVDGDQLVKWGVSAVYADPPYTAQQYSRFYHLLETLVRGSTPRLQRVDGRVTRGLYPEGRYLSPFCSRRKAPGAIDALVDACAGAGASLVVSYSEGSGPESGNARMVSLADLTRRIEARFGAANVTVERLDHAYRRFNSTDLTFAEQEMPEFLIVASA